MSGHEKVKPALIKLARASRLEVTRSNRLVIAVAISDPIANPEDGMAGRAGTAPVVAVAAPTIIANVVVAAAAFVVAALVTDVAVLLTLVATNLLPLGARECSVRTIAAPLGAKLPLAFAYQTRLIASNLTGADTAPDALTVLAFIDPPPIAALRKRLGSGCQKQSDDPQKK